MPIFGKLIVYGDAKVSTEILKRDKRVEVEKLFKHLELKY